ncbi:MAG: hypothetical protein Q7K45_05370 [Nanoarchaeota archaeon]|nr:hypothetical protein [Nanoarchaeota archaeon]
MVFFLTHVEPLHLLYGQEALFFIREQSKEGNKSHVVVKPIPHYFFTRPLALEEAYCIADNAEHDRSLEHLAITSHEYSQYQQFLRAEGSKEDRHFLTENFICKGILGNNDPTGLNSPSRLLRWLYPPFLLLKGASADAIPEPEEMLNDRTHRNYASAQQVLSDSYAVLDIEVRDWQTGNDQIFMVVYLCPAQNKKIIYHDFDYEGAEYGEIQLQRFTSQEELGQLLTQRVQDDDPLWEMGHNLMNYDRLQLRNITEEYFPAANKHHPITKSAQGLGRVLSKGRFTVDTYPYTFNYQSIFANNKLSTHARFTKSVSYDEMDRLGKEARAGNRKSLEKLFKYTLEDGIRTEELGLQLRERVATKSRHFRRDPDSVCSTGKSNLAQDSWDRKYFFLKGCPPHSWKERREEHTFSLEKCKEEFLGTGFTQGFVDDVHILYLTPFIPGCLPLLNRTSRDLLREFQNSKNPLEKFDWLQTINAELSSLVGEMDTLLHQEGHSFQHLPSTLSGKQYYRFCELLSTHGMEGINALDLLENITHSLRISQQRLEGLDIINRGTQLYALRGDIDIQSLEKKFYGCYLGKGNVLSLREGRFVANPFQETMSSRYVYQGFRTNAGGRCNFEKRTLQSLVESIFQGDPFKDITASLNKELREFADGKKPREEYYFSQKTRTYYRTILETVLENRGRDAKSTITPAIVQEYAALKHRIGDRYGGETERELNGIIEHCRTDFSYSYILEVMERIEHPFPERVNLVYAAGLPTGEMMLESMTALLDLPQYTQQVQELFTDFYEILKPQQLQLFPAGPAAGKPRKRWTQKKEKGKGKQLSLRL